MQFFKKHRNRFIIELAALVFTFLQVAGWQCSMKYDSSVHGSTLKSIGMLKPWQCLTVGLVEWRIWSLALRFLFNLLDRTPAPKTTDSSRLTRFLWPISAGTIFVTHVLFLIACYPGLYNYDMGNQLPQMLYKDVPFNAHHPLLHTIVGGGIIKLGYLIDSSDLTLGVFLYCAFQMLVCAICFGYTLKYIWQFTGNKVLFTTGWIFYALCPPLYIFGMCTTKDVMCYAVLLVAAVRIFDIDHRLLREQAIARGEWWIAGMLLALSCLLRKNISYALVVSAVFSISLVRKKRKTQLLMYIGALLAYMIINNSLIMALHAPKSSVAEALSVPFQQMARLYQEKGETAFEGEELDLLYAAIDPDMLPNYDPMMADEIKTAFWLHLDTIMQNKGTYFSLWARKGLQYPGIYIASFLDNTYQAWYPWTGNKCYRGYRYVDITAWQEDYGRPKWPAFYEFVKETKESSYGRYPMWRLLFATGTYFWVALFAFFYNWWKKDRAVISASLLILLVCATSLCGPVSDVRYYLILFYMMPVYLSWIFGRKTEEK